MVYFNFLGTFVLGHCIVGMIRACVITWRPSVWGRAHAALLIEMIAYILLCTNYLFQRRRWII
jgi:uncharacterized protein (DUF983 family)